MPKLKDQIAVVTGASGGIGGAIAAALAAEGAKVYLVGRDREKLEAVAARMRVPSSVAVPWPMDLTRAPDVTRFGDQLTREPGRIDILVHCAGIMAHGPLGDASLESLDRHYAANLRGPLMLTQGLLPLLMKPRGQIVFVNSTAGLAARANAGHYSAMQHAVKALADSLRDEVNRHDVRVTSVFPGRTATPRTEALFASEGRSYRPELLLQPEDVAAAVTCALTLPWTAEVTNLSIRSMRKSY